MTICPEESIYESINEIRIAILICVIATIIVIILFTSWYIRKNISLRLDNISHTLFSFFKLLNHENVKVDSLKVLANDELGRMANEINNSILNAQKNLEKDRLLVKDSLKVIECARGGKVAVFMSEDREHVV